MGSLNVVRRGLLTPYPLTGTARINPPIVLLTADRLHCLPNGLVPIDNNGFSALAIAERPNRFVHDDRNLCIQFDGGRSEASLGLAQFGGRYSLWKSTKRPIA